MKFCHRLGLTYVSCSPFRVPVARLAAAQAALEEASAVKPLNIKIRTQTVPPKGALGKNRIESLSYANLQKCIQAAR